MKNKIFIFNFSLNKVATQCPLTGGHAVYQARNLIMYIENGAIEFEDNCDDTKKSMELIPSDSVSYLASFVKLYPNPNNGNITLEYQFTHIGEFIITDISGREICRYSLSNTENKSEINCNKLINGTYIYKVFSAGKLIKVDKFIVNK